MAACPGVTEYNDFLSKDASRISGRILESLAINNPYMGIMEKGEFTQGYSDVQRSVIQERVAPVLSQVTPNWEPWACRSPFNQIKTGTTEREYNLQKYKEIGPEICLATSYSAVEDALIRAENAIEDHALTHWLAKDRYELYKGIGNKVTVIVGAASESAVLNTGYGSVFKNTVPTGPMSFQTIKYFANYLRHTALASEPYWWNMGGELVLKFVSDQATVDKMRTEAIQDLRYAMAGGFRDKVDDVFAFSWNGPYQGIAFGVDQTIPRAVGQNGGEPIFAEPFTSANATKGTKAVPNPQYQGAKYQISFLFARMIMRKEIPVEFLGKGMTRFQRQYFGGDVRWHNVQDNNCNDDGDIGWHKMRYAAAYKPLRIDFGVVFFHARCADDLGMTAACTYNQQYSL